jgi:ketosteroid isomerase-like protein
VIQRLYDAFARGDGAAALAELHDHVEWNEAESFLYADGNPYQSPAAVGSGVFGRLLADWESWTVTVSEIIEAGDTIVALGRSKGVFRATGRSVDAQFAHVWRVQDEKIVGFQQYTDTLQVHGATSPL